MNINPDSPILWLIALIVIGLIFWAILREHKKRQARTVEEYEEAVRSGDIIPKAMLKAGVLELEGILNPTRRAAMEYVEAENKGHTKTQKKGGKGRKRRKRK
jgi:hypothetical protein